VNEDRQMALAIEVGDVQRDVRSPADCVLMDAGRWDGTRRLTV
jgi:hypothetical protein